MPPGPDSSSTSPTAQLESGLAALKHKDYATAIAQLEAVSLPLEHPLAAKAQMGLAVAYANSGDPVRAVKLCQSLNQSSNSQIKDWAIRTLNSLMQRYPQLASQLQSDQQGAVADGEASNSQAARLQDRQLSDTEADLTGFTPFAEPANSEPDATGFIPLDSPPQSRLQRLTPKAIVDQSTQPPIESAQFAENASTSHDTSSSQPFTNQSAANLSSAESAQLAGSTAWLEQERSDDASTPLASELPDSAPVVEQPLPYHPIWRQAERAKQWQPLGKLNLAPLWLLQAGTAIALFWMVQTIIYSAMTNYGIALTKIPLLELRRYEFGPPVWPILLGLSVLLVTSRWLLDWLLTVAHGLQPLSSGKLAVYSPESVQLLQRVCRQKRLPTPALRVLPTTAPLAFSYGVLPRFTRIVVSQGLLEQLADDEISAIYAGEMSHLITRTVPLLSLVTVITQIPYTVYWVVAEWGNRQQLAILRGIASGIAAISYGLYALLRWVALWLSRQRLYYSDRIASELTGNPNGLTRALLKIAIGTASNVQSQGRTSYLLEKFDLLTPLGYRLATTVGSTYPYAPIEAVLEWDRVNPYRHWLAINNSHPPTGDRLNLLARYAQRWKLTTELDLNADSLANQRPQTSKPTARQWRTLLLQGAPFFGFVGGFTIAIALFAVGWIGTRLNLAQIAWMYGDQALLTALPLIGFSLGTFIRINSLFPEIKFASISGAAAEPILIDLLKKPTQIPIDSLPMRLQGNLLGRAGMSNYLSQDLLLQTTTGIVRLHCLSQLGPVGNLLPQSVRSTDLIGQEVVVTGWFRRGVVPWIDVETIRTLGGRTHRSSHPIWSTILGFLTAAWGIYSLLQINSPQ